MLFFGSYPFAPSTAFRLSVCPRNVYASLILSSAMNILSYTAADAVHGVEHNIQR